LEFKREHHIPQRKTHPLFFSRWKEDTIFFFFDIKERKKEKKKEKKRKREKERKKEEREKGRKRKEIKKERKK